MQITLNSEQSQALESLIQRGGYNSLDDAIDAAIVLLADEVTQQESLDDSPEYLAWVESARLKVEAGMRAAQQGDVVEVDDVLAGLRRKVADAKAASA